MQTIEALALETAKLVAEKTTESVVAMAQELKEVMAAELKETRHAVSEAGTEVGKHSQLLEQYLNKQENLRHIEQWIKEINPNYDPFDINSPYSRNCGSCALAVYKRLEGDCTAVASAKNIGQNWEMEALTGMVQVKMDGPEAIRQALLAQGDGAHAIIGVDRAYGPGHWFNAVNVDGKVMAIDGQSGEILDWPPDYGNVVNWEMSKKLS